MKKEKTCSSCSVSFSCGANETNSRCWRNNYPPLFKPDLRVDCMYPDCLKKATKDKINQSMSQMTAEKALTDNKARLLPRTRHYIEDIDYYIQDSYWVFINWHHLMRGYCCRNGGRHCPYGFLSKDDNP